MSEYLYSGPLPTYPPFLNLAKARSPSLTLLMFETKLIPAQAYEQNTISIDCNCGRYPDCGPRDLGERHPHRTGKLGGNLMSRIEHRRIRLFGVPQRPASGDEQLCAPRLFGPSILTSG